MESTTSSLTVEEIQEAIVFWLKETKGVEVDEEIWFDIREEYDPNDWQARNPPIPVLAGASFTVKK